MLLLLLFAVGVALAIYWAPHWLLLKASTGIPVGRDLLVYPAKARMGQLHSSGQIELRQSQKEALSP